MRLVEGHCAAHRPQRRRPPFDRLVVAVESILPVVEASWTAGLLVVIAARPATSVIIPADEDGRDDDEKDEQSRSGRHQVPINFGDDPAGLPSAWLAQATAAATAQAPPTTTLGVQLV